MDTENTTPDDLAGTPEENSASAEPTAATPQVGEDTGEIAEVQAEAAESPSESPPDQPKDETPTDVDADSTPAAVAPEPALELPTWVQQISRYHNDMNGLLAGKENLKIMAVNTSARPSFYKKWVYEANQFARLTVNLRHRKRRALARLRDEAAKKSTDSAA